MVMSLCIPQQGVGDAKWHSVGGACDISQAAPCSSGTTCALLLCCFPLWTWTRVETESCDNSNHDKWPDVSQPFASVVGFCNGPFAFKKCEKQPFFKGHWTTLGTYSPVLIAVKSKTFLLSICPSVHMSVHSHDSNISKNPSINAFNMISQHQREGISLHFWYTHSELYRLCAEIKTWQKAPDWVGGSGQPAVSLYLHVYVWMQCEASLQLQGSKLWLCQ